MKFTPAEPQRLMIERQIKDLLFFGCVGMGIGKTAASLYAFNELYNGMETHGALVIAPLRVVNLTWPMEIAQWDQFKWMRVANLRTQLGRRAFIAGAAHIYLINYESIPLLAKLVEKRGGELPYDTIIYDESTKMKNPSAKRINLLRNEVPKVPRRWALTGTPAPNSLLDLFAQVRMLDDGERLGRSYDHFKKTYFHATDYQQYNWVANAGTQETIEQRISDITLVLRTSDWLKDVPDAVVEDVEITMPAKLMDQYREFEEELILELRQEVQITAANAAALVTKLLQFTSGAVYDGEKVAHHVHDLKMNALKKIVKESKTPVLVAVNFKHEQDRIRKEFPQARFFADAKTESMQVQLLTQWNRREIPVLVAHPKSCGHGLNMQMGSSLIVYYSLTYSREAYEQMIARLVRRGQKEPVTIMRLMCPGTVDDAIATVLESKRDTETRLLSALMMLESAKSLKVPVVKEVAPDEDEWLN